MSDKSGIQWTDATWNPVTGCSKVSQGCKNCYALRDWARVAAPRATPNVYTGREFTDVRFHPERLDQPLRWKKPRRVFVNSMSDLFHEKVPDEAILQVFDVMRQCANGWTEQLGGEHGIRIVYAKVPETGGVMDVVIRSVMQAFDQLHSLMSREKGLAGMAENVRQGWRAGGRAPMGYQLERVPTGAMRDGSPVSKSRLVPGPEAPRVARYLHARACGTARHLALSDTGLQLAQSSAIGMEWQALTYAGHTVWGMHEQRVTGGYRGGRKRRARADWLIQYDTHPALITTEEAEAILGHLERGRATSYRTSAVYLLTGLLRTPDGQAWHSSGDGCYRAGKGRRVRQDEIEQAVVGRVIEDLQSDRFVAELLAQARRLAAPPTHDELEPLRQQVSDITARIGKLADLAAQVDTPRPFLERIRAAEKERAALLAQLEEAEATTRAADVLRAISEADVRRLLAGLAASLDQVDREPLKDALAGLLERVDLTADGSECVIHYRISTGDFVASPRGAGEIPVLRVARRIAG